MNQIEKKKTKTLGQTLLGEKKKDFVSTQIPSDLNENDYVKLFSAYGHKQPKRTTDFFTWRKSKDERFHSFQRSFILSSFPFNY